MSPFHEMARFLIVLLPCALGFVPGSPSPAGARAGVARAAGGKDRSFIPPSADKYYEQIAQRNGASLSQVQALAYEQAVEATQSGHYVQDSNGSWRKK